MATVADVEHLPAPATVALSPTSRSVFLVHGHNEEIKQAVARPRPGLDPLPLALAASE